MSATTFSHINKEEGFTISLLIVIYLSISLISIVIGYAFAKTITRKKHNEATKVGVQIYTQQYLTAEVKYYSTLGDSSAQDLLSLKSPRVAEYITNTTL